MLHIVALILKIIGMILAVILGIIVSLVCIVLFVPVRYEISAMFPGKMEEIAAKVKFSWLFHLIVGEAAYAEKEFQWKVRAAWFKFSGDEEKTVETTVKEEAKDLSQREVPQKEAPQKEASQNEIPQKELSQEGAQQEEVSQKEPSPKKALQNKQEEEKKQKVSFWQKIKNKIKEIWEKIKYTFSQVCAKIKSVSEMKERITVFLTDEAHKQAFQKAKKELKWIIRFLRPKKFKLDLHYGFEDPYTTGQVLAALSMIYPFVGDNMSVQPDFENQVLEGEFYMKGNLRMIFPAVYLIKLILNKNVRRTFIDVKNFKLK